MVLLEPVRSSRKLPWKLPWELPRKLEVHSEAKLQCSGSKGVPWVHKLLAMGRFLSNGGAAVVFGRGETATGNSTFGGSAGLIFGRGDMNGGYSTSRTAIGVEEAVAVVSCTVAVAQGPAGNESPSRMLRQEIGIALVALSSRQLLLAQLVRSGIAARPP